LVVKANANASDCKKDKAKALGFKAKANAKKFGLKAKANV